MQNAIENENVKKVWKIVKVGMIFVAERFCVSKYSLIFEWLKNDQLFFENGENLGKGNPEVTPKVTLMKPLQVIDIVIEVSEVYTVLGKGNPAAAHCASPRYTDKKIKVPFRVYFSKILNNRVTFGFNLTKQALSRKLCGYLWVTFRLPCGYPAS